METSLLDALERLKPGDHLCSIYETQEEQFASMVPFLRIGLEQGEKCVYVAQDCTFEPLRAALQAAGVEVGPAIQSGALVLTTPHETQLKIGHFSPERMQAFWRAEVEAVRRSGYIALRVTGGPDWATPAAPEGERWMEYESLVTNILTETGSLALCQYDRRRYTPEVILDVIRTHPIVVCGNQVCHNYYFVTPEEFLANGCSEREVERQLHTLREQERTAARLREAQKMEAMGQLAGGIAHDFNNLMTIVTGYSKLVSAALGGNPSLQEKVEEIRKAGEQASSLTRQLLAFSRRQMVQPKLLDLKSVLTEMGKMLRRLVNENIELSLLNDFDPCLIRADRSQIEQVILNLVVNGRDAMPEGGRLVLAVRNTTLGEKEAKSQSARPGTYVRLSISDTGHGMDAQTRMRVFEPFFTAKEPGKGTGLGLATVYGIVKQAGGNVTVASEPGRGAIFEVYFPRAEGEIVQEVQSEVAQPAGGSETILVVEDQDGLRSLMSEILGQHGYRVITARNGQEALLLMQKERGRVDLVITDLVMPQMGGRELAKALPVFHPETKVVFMSGYVDNVSEMLSNGPAFIDKPFTPEALLRKVRDVLDRGDNSLSAA